MSLNEGDIPRLLKAAAEYEKLSRSTTIKHERLAFDIGARVYEIEPADLKSKNHDFNEERLKLMAFARVVSIGSKRKPTSYPRIGKAFGRVHSTAQYAVYRYGDAIARLLGKGAAYAAEK